MVRPDDRLAFSYRHDPSLVPDLAQLADAACEGIQDPHEAMFGLEGLAARMHPGLERHAMLAVLNTFVYVLRVEPVETLQPGAELDPLTGPSLWPVALRDAGEDLRQLWLALASEVKHPVIRSRCWDIVFTLRLVRNGRDAAERAVRAYLDVVSTSLRPDHQARGLLRAWTLARKVRLVAVMEEIVATMKVVVEDAVAGEEHPYTVVPLLGALIAPPPRGFACVPDDPVVADLLNRALRAYPHRHIIKDIAMLIRRSAGANSRRAEDASRYEVGAMIVEAEAAVDPMIIRTLYNDAASEAKRLGLADLESLAVARLQAAPAMAWQSTAYSVTIPEAFFDWYLPGFDVAANWRQALAIWMHTGSPSGRKDANERSARSAIEGSLVSFLASTTLFRDDMPTRSILTEEDRFEREMVRAESHHMAMNGRFLARALYLIRERFGIPPRRDLEAFLRSFHAAPTLVTPLATGLHLYWVGEYEASCHLVIPKVEAATRALLLELNEPLYRTAVGDGTGQFPGLGSLLPHLLANDFDPDWERFLRTFLLNDGLNYRNLIAHGFTDTAGPVEAALALRASSLLVLLTTDQAATRDAAAVRAALTSIPGLVVELRFGAVAA